MWCVVGTRRSRTPGAAVVLLTGAFICASASGCSFNPTGSGGDNGGGGDDDDTGGTVPDGGGVVDPGDASPGIPDADETPVECTPGETRCGSNGRSLQLCNPEGTAFENAVECAFSCEEDEHCTLASNLPEADQTACTGAGARLAPAPGTTVTIAEGQITCSADCGNGQNQIASSGDITDGELQMTYYCLSEVTIPDQVNVTAQAGLARSVGFYVAGEVVVAGSISLDGTSADADSAGPGGPGGGVGASQSNDDGDDAEGNCPGQGGVKEEEFPPPGNSRSAGGGGGGGGYGASGGGGGIGLDSSGDQAMAGAAGSSCGSQTLAPLIGGSGGGGGADGTCGTQCGWPGGGGGGAIQISAIGGITVTGTISARGGNGFGVTNGDESRGGGGGGGSGGAILLEGPQLTIDSGALVVEGGIGGAAGAGGGGAGGSQDTSNGGVGTGASANSQGGAGGGGAGGRVRLNASAGGACDGNLSSPSGVCSGGALRRGGGIGGQQ